MPHSQEFLELVQDAKTRIKENNIQDVKQKLENHEPMNLFDVREYEEWQKGHIPNAKWLGKGIIERDIDKQVQDKSAEVILYCGGGFRSALAADNLQKMGYSNVISMDGGFRAWTEADFPVD